MKLLSTLPGILKDNQYYFANTIPIYLTLELGVTSEPINGTPTAVNPPKAENEALVGLRVKAKLELNVTATMALAAPAMMSNFIGCVPFRDVSNLRHT